MPDSREFIVRGNGQTATDWVKYFNLSLGRWEDIFDKIGLVALEDLKFIKEEIHEDFAENKKSLTDIEAHLKDKKEYDKFMVALENTFFEEDENDVTRASVQYDNGIIADSSTGSEEMKGILNFSDYVLQSAGSLSSAHAGQGEGSHESKGSKELSTMAEAKHSSSTANSQDRAAQSLGMSYFQVDHDMLEESKMPNSIDLRVVHGLGESLSKSLTQLSESTISDLDMNISQGSKLPTTAEVLESSLYKQRLAEGLEKILKKDAVVSEKDKRKKKAIRKLIQEAEKKKTLDLFFVVDCTGSMDVYMNEIKEKIKEVIDALGKTASGLIIRLAFVGYRDFSEDKEDSRLAVLPPTNSVEEFQDFIAGQKAYGGGDEAEDVLGGLHVVSAAEKWWRSEMRVLYHIGNAPCHGSKFHTEFCNDDYPEGDPNGLQAKAILDKLKADKVKYFFVKISDSTDIMIKKFNVLAADNYKEGDEDKEDVFHGFYDYDEDEAEQKGVGEEDAHPAAVPFIQVLSLQGMDLMNLVTITLSAYVTETLSVGSSYSTVDSTADYVELITLMPNWNTRPEEKVAVFRLKPINDLAQLLGQVNDHCVEDLPDPESGLRSFKMASSPFAKGRHRRAYYGTGIASDHVQHAVVLKALHKTSKNNQMNNHEGFLACHQSASFLADQFNSRRPPDCPGICYVEACIVKFYERNPDQPFLVCEKRIACEGNGFEKYNNNMDLVLLNPSPKHHIDHSAVQAFSHFSYCFTDGYMLVVDCQGSYNKSTNSFELTDPAVNCKEVGRFGTTNLGLPGMGKFFRVHKCNDYCKAMNLKVPSAEELSDADLLEDV